MSEQNQNMNPQQSEKERTKQNTKEAIQAAEKGAGAAFGGGTAGIAAVNAAHKAPVVGKALDKAEDKLAEGLSKNKAIGQLANKAKDSGITDTANKGLDMAGAVGGGGAGAASGAASGAAGSAATSGAANAASKAGGASQTASKAGNTSGKPSSGASKPSSSPGSGSSKLNPFSKGDASQTENYSVGAEFLSPENIKKLIKVIPIIVGAFFVMLLIMLVVVVVVALPMRAIDSVNSWIESGKNAAANFFEQFGNFMSGNGWSSDEQAFLNAANEKYEYYEARNVQLNIPLIMSTLMTRQLYTNVDITEDIGEEFANIDETQTDVNSIRYGSMIGDVRKLSEYQVVKTFSLPSVSNPSVYETVLNPPFAILNGAANILNVTADTLFPSNIKLSNANYLSNLRFGKTASEDAINSEKSSYSTLVGSSSGNVRLTNFIDNTVGWMSMSPYGNKKERFRLNEKGWWMYSDPDTHMEYLAVAAPTTYGLQGAWGTHYEQYPEITYYEYGDIINLNISGENYQAMVIDSCGACMTARNPIKIDVYVSRDYFSESGITSAGRAAGAVTPDDLTTTMGSVQNKPTQDFWQYVDPTESEKQDIDGYKNGYIYKAYSEVFENVSDSEIPDKVESIIQTIYDMRDNYLEYSESIYGKTSSDTIEGERTTRPSRTNSFFYDQTTDSGANGTLEGECAWYGTGRAAEYLASINSPLTWTDNPNGGEFCDSNDAKKFNTGTVPKAGSLVSWAYEPWGHVAFVESVNADGTFNITEAGISFGQWGKSARSIINSGNNAQLRKENCEGNGTGCLNIQRNITTSAYRQFKCFIYLNEPKNGGNTNE